MTKVATTQVNSTQGLELLARSGYAARGIVYLIVAFFAVQAARGSASYSAPLFQSAFHGAALRLRWN